MAFMMPVVKNEWDIYNTQRQRRISECSSSCRSRKVSECSKSEGPSLSTSPGSEFIVASPGHHHRSVPSNMSRQYSRISSRTSQSSLVQSPCKSMSSSPPKNNGSTTSLNKFHNRLLDKLKRSLRKDSSENEKTSS